jgi:HK97 family phage prohead protease
MNRSYSILTVKAVDEEQRIIQGTATTPTPDRVGDIIDPLGVKYTNPLPLLHQHDSERPVGTVTFDRPTKDGITFEARLPMIAEAGPLKDRVDTAWGEVKAGLIRAVSIGFRAIEFAFMETGIRYMETEVLELSLVSVPANAEAKISVVKSIDAPLLAATGKEPQASDRPTPPGASGKKSVKPVSLRPKEGPEMKTSEHIASLEASRAAKAARMADIMQKSMDEGRSTDDAEREEFDTLEQEVDAIDGDLKRFRGLEKAAVATARPATNARTVEDGAAARSGIVVKQAPKLQPGIGFARLAKIKAISRLDSEPAASVAERLYGADSEVTALCKAAVVAGTTISGNWAADLVGTETGVFADFVEYLRPATILGKFGVNGVPALRRIPFRVPLISQTGGGSGYWVGQGKPKPLTAFDFDRTTLEPLKVANIAVLTEESIRDSSPSSEMIIRDALRAALAERLDTDFIDPAKAASSGVSPASITYGASHIVSTGNDADDVRLDVRAVFQKFIDANNPPSTGVWIMSTANALALALMVNALGQPEFPGLTMMGGMFFGLPAIVSDYADDIVALVNASDIYEADDGGVSVDMSREASLEMKDSSLTQDATNGTGVAMVSMFQTNSVALRAERTINWKARRASAVAYLSAVGWGGAVPAS